MKRDEGELEATWLRIIAVGAIAVGCIVYVTASYAAPHAQSAVECEVAGDMAVAARAMAEERVDRKLALALMHRMYDVSDSERGTRLMAAIVATAYRLPEGTAARNFGQELQRHCLRSGGNMDGVLGTEL